MKITTSPLIAAFGMKTWRLRSKRVVFGWKALCSSEQVRFVGYMSAFRIIDFWYILKKYIVFHQNKVQYIVYMMFLLVIGLIGLIGNSVSIVVLSKPDMYNCFNQLLITLSTMDSVFIILAMIDYSFNRYVPYFLYFLENTKKYCYRLHFPSQSVSIDNRVWT